jgi:hypothetical protein
MTDKKRTASATSERQRRAEVVRLIITTREKFPHSPRLMNALRRVLWRYAMTPRSMPKRRRQ